MSLKSIYETIADSHDEHDIFNVRIRLNPSHPVYAGHFPDNPITPGVILIHILKEILEKHFNTKLFLTETSHVKFLSIINPNLDPELLFNLKIEAKDKLFTVKNTTTSPDGRIVLKCNATFVRR